MIRKATDYSIQADVDSYFFVPILKSDLTVKINWFTFFGLNHGQSYLPTYPNQPQNECYQRSNIDAELVFNPGINHRDKYQCAEKGCCCIDIYISPFEKPSVFRQSANPGKFLLQLL